MITYKQEKFIWQGAFQDRHQPKDAGFQWDPYQKRWWTSSPYAAYALRDQADQTARRLLLKIADVIVSSQQADDTLLAEEIPAPAGQSWYPFQAAGVDHMAQQLRNGRKAVLCADEQGLGKSCQAVGVANALRARKLLVICPASLRLNWAREIEAWHLYNPGVEVVLSGAKAPVMDISSSIVTSYNLAKKIKHYTPDLVIVDEAHYLKNPTTKRTRLILGGDKRWSGFVSKAPTIFLTGTPIPNGRPNEAYPVLSSCAADVIDNLGVGPFIHKYCTYTDDDYGRVVTGAKNTQELYARLRGSGFMLRRLKKDVLKSLPPKRYKMVVFPETGDTRRVLQKENVFSVQEILDHGIPAGSGLPDIRREMGMAKLPQCVEYITDMLESGVDKVVLFAHHRDVVFELEAALRPYCPMTLIGGMSAAQKQEAVDSFQNDPRVRVFIGNEAAEEGHTLTAAQDVVIVEPEWVPGKNDQRVDRLHRIGQTGSVLVHYLVVEKSLDAQILQAETRKRQDINNVLERR